MSQVLKYYVSGHTALGFVNFLQSNLMAIQKVIVLEHTSRQVVSDVLKEIQKKMGADQAQEILCSSFRKDEMEGLLLPDESIGFVAKHLAQDEEVEQIHFDLHEWLPIDEKDENIEKEKSLQAEAYTHFHNGLLIHDELEQIYIDEMDFAVANQLADNVMKHIFNGSTEQKKQPMVTERLFGTNTIDGVVNEVEQLIAPLESRFFIKGRAGTGKSVLMKKVVEQSKRYGYDTEVYRCSFDPNSIDMVIIRELGYCLFDSTAPHEFFPSRKTDQVIDLYERTVKDGTDEKYAKQIKRVTEAYKAEVKQGLNCLKEIKKHATNVEMTAENYTHLITKVGKELIREI